jgi:hypothetical protein
VCAAVEFAEPDYLVSVNWKPNDPLLPAQWHHATIDSYTAWNASRGSPQIKVGMKCNRWACQVAGA